VNADEDHHIEVVATRYHDRQKRQQQAEATNLEPFVFKKTSQFSHLSLVTCHWPFGAAVIHKHSLVRPNNPMT
jgi:hypothetical protein